MSYQVCKSVARLQKAVRLPLTYVFYQGVWVMFNEFLTKALLCELLQVILIIA